MTLDLRSVQTRVIVGGLDLSSAFVSLSIGGNALDDSGWFKPRGQIVLAAYADSVTEDMDCRTNPGRWAPGTVVAVSVWFGAWIPLPWQLRILSYPNRPSPAQPTLTLEVGTDADLLNYRAPEGDPGSDEYGTPAGATTLINRALTRAGAPSLSDTITTLSLPFSPAKTTSGSWMTYAGSVAYAARVLLWQQTNGDIRATPLTLDGLTPLATYTVGTDEADYILDRVGEQPPEIVEVQGTTYRIESAEPEDTDVTEIVNGVQTRTRVEYQDWNTASPKVVETVWIPLELIAPPKFSGNTSLSILQRTTTTRNYDTWDRLTSTEITVEQPWFIVRDDITNNQSMTVFSQTTVTNVYPLSFAAPEIIREVKTREIITRRDTVEQTLTGPPWLLKDRLITVETWDKNGPEKYLYRRTVQDYSEERLTLPSLPNEARFTPPPATEFKPAAKQRTELQRRGQARFTNAVGSSYAEKKAIITLPSGMAASSDQCRAHASLWGRIRQGRQFPIKWAADISAAWLQNWSPVRRVDFTLGGVTTAYLVEAFNIQIDQRSAAVGGLGFELGRTTAGVVTNPPYVVVPEVFAEMAIGGLSFAADVDVQFAAWYQAQVGGLSFAASIQEADIDATHAGIVGGLSMAALADPVLDATHAAAVEGLSFGAAVDDSAIAMLAATVDGLSFGASGGPVVDATQSATVGGLTFGSEVEPVVTLWTPEQITTVLWLDAADSSTITESGGVVSQWDDKSGNGRNATQATSGNRPSYTLNQLNGLNVVSFNGSSQWFSNFASFGAGHFAAVAQANQSKSFMGLFTASSSELILNLQGTSVFQGNTSYVNGSTTLTLTSSQPFVWGLNLAQTRTAERSFGQEFNAPGSTRAWNGYCGELIVTAQPQDTATRNKVEGYLAHKWGLTANLPSNHPYKTNPPIV